MDGIPAELQALIGRIEEIQEENRRLAAENEEWRRRWDAASDRAVQFIEAAFIVAEHEPLPPPRQTVPTAQVKSPPPAPVSPPVAKKAPVAKKPAKKAAKKRPAKTGLSPLQSYILDHIAREFDGSFAGSVQDYAAHESHDRSTPGSLAFTVRKMAREGRLEIVRTGRRLIRIPDASAPEPEPEPEASKPASKPEAPKSGASKLTEPSGPSGPVSLGPIERPARFDPDKTRAQVPL